MYVVQVILKEELQRQGTRLGLILGLGYTDLTGSSSYQDLLGTMKGGWNGPRDVTGARLGWSLWGFAFCFLNSRKVIFYLSVSQESSR